MRQLALGLILCSQIAIAKDLPLIGLDKDGSPVEVFVKKEKYRAQLRVAVRGVQISALPVLDKHDAKMPWSLRTIVIGVGLSIEVGIGPILKVAAAPRFRALFSNAKDPVLP